MSQQQLTVFLDQATYDLLLQLRHQGNFEHDDEVVRAAFAALKREWRLSGNGSLPARDPNLPDDEIFHRKASHSPDDYDT